MRQIKAQMINVEDFSEFGQFFNMSSPQGSALGTFYNDKILYPVSGNMPVGFSSLICKKTEKMLITDVEYHDYTPECMLPLDDDVVLHVAPASKMPVPDQTRAFIVPAGTMIKINTGVWHMGMIPVHNDEVHVLIVLPERVYNNDCKVVTYEEKDQMEIVL